MAKDVYLLVDEAKASAEILDEESRCKLLELGAEVKSAVMEMIMGIKAVFTAMKVQIEATDSPLLALSDFIKRIKERPDYSIQSVVEKPLDNVDANAVTVSQEITTDVVQQNIELGYEEPVEKFWDSTRGKAL